MPALRNQLSEELQAFQGIWEGGYYEGDPLNPLSRSTFGQLGYISILHATFLRCVKPYITNDTIALEIGPGRGAWTKAMLPAKEVWALDALPEEHNRFYEYLGHPSNVKYFQVNDFECNELPDDYFDYMFSFGCLCHISFKGIAEYAANIYSKLKHGSNCFWMIADYDKYNSAVSNIDSLSIWKALSPKSRKLLPLRYLFRYFMKRQKLQFIKPDENDEPRPGGRWYNAGIARTCSMLEEVGYRIVDPDVGTCLRDPIIHFFKT